ncbi:30S ribosomal protein S6 [Candidatus Nomurabacteria bacterium]|nr:30S ribosomal protein S6 [Candidatus Nomurabacteria bacterium]
MQEYELTVLIHPDRESELEKQLTTLRDIIKSVDGKVKTEENWGKKRLAYPIKKENFAVYVNWTLELPADAPLKVSNTFNITDGVLRYLLVKMDEKERKALEAARAGEKAASEEE